MNAINPDFYTLRTDAQLNSASCSVVYKNQLYIYGGSLFPNQVLSFDCEEQSLYSNKDSTLAFDFVNGACSSNNLEILLCFSSQDSQQCYTSYDPVPRDWWQKFISIRKSKFQHKSIAISMSKDITLAVGGIGHSKTELLSLSTWKWSTSASYLNYSEVYSFATFVYEPDKQNPYLTKFYVIAGNTDIGKTSDIAKFDPNLKKWTRVGQLIVSRKNLQVTLLESSLYVIGGSKYTEKCYFSENPNKTLLFDCKKIEIEGLSRNFTDDDFPQLYGHHESECNLGMKSILILNVRRLVNVPVLTDVDGLSFKLNETRFNMRNEYNSTYRVWKSCGIPFKGDFYIYGGFINNMDQILKVQDCSLKEIGRLGFMHEHGSCSATLNEIFLCFGRANPQKCFISSDPKLTKYTEKQSLFKHDKIRTAASQSKFYRQIYRADILLKMKYLRVEVQAILIVKFIEIKLKNGRRYRVIHLTRNQKNLIFKVFQIK